MTSFIFSTATIGILYILGFFPWPEKISAKLPFLRKYDLDWMSRDYTTALKGFSILTVVWAHIGAQLGVQAIQFIAGTGVALFLILSGYGLEISWQKNGGRHFWKKRFFRICVPVYLVEISWQLYHHYWDTERFFSHAVLLRAVRWFVPYILICYVIYYIVKLCCRFIPGKVREEYLYLLLFGAFFVFECIFPYNDAIPFLRARQMLSFPLGVIIAKHKDRFFLIPKKKKRILTIGFGFFGVIFLAITQVPVIYHGNYFVLNILSLPTVLFFATCILLITDELKCLLQNRFFYFVGLCSYELFVIQSYTIPYVHDSRKYCVAYVVGVIILAMVFYLIVSMLEKGIKYGFNYYRNH